MTKHMMECWEAQELLEGIDVGAISADDALAVDAQRHHSQCAACRTMRADRRVWNTRLTAAMTDVPVPADLETRLLERLGTVTSPVVAAPRTTRRRWIVSLAVMASLVLIACLWQPWKPASPMINLALVDAHITCDLTAVTPYAGRGTPTLPRVWRSFFQLKPGLVHHFPAGTPGALSVAALVPFQFQAGQAVPPIRGRLVMVPVDDFLDAPEEGDFLNVNEVDYLPSGFSRCVWREGNWVYVCYVRTGGGGELRDLKQLMQASSNVA